MGYSSLETVFPNFKTSTVRNPNLYIKPQLKTPQISYQGHSNDNYKMIEKFETGVKSTPEAHGHFMDCDKCRYDMYIAFSDMYEMRRSQQRLSDIIETLLLLFTGWVIIMLIKKLQ